MLNKCQLASLFPQGSCSLCAHRTRTINFVCLCCCDSRAHPCRKKARMTQRHCWSQQSQFGDVFQCSCAFMISRRVSRRWEFFWRKCERFEVEHQTTDRDLRKVDLNSLRGCLFPYNADIHSLRVDATFAPSGWEIYVSCLSGWGRKTAKLQAKSPTALKFNLIRCNSRNRDRAFTPTWCGAVWFMAVLKLPPQLPNPLLGTCHSLSPGSFNCKSVSQSWLLSHTFVSSVIR